VHSALGFWGFLFVLMLGISGFYFCFPQTVNALSGFVDPSDKYADRALGWLSMAHFGRFGWACRGALDLVRTDSGGPVTHRCISMLPPHDLQSSASPTVKTRD
jgi:hypothetical protein